MGGVKMNLLLANNPREKYLTGDTLQGNVNNGVMDQVATIMPQVEKMLPKLDSILASLNTILETRQFPVHCTACKTQWQAWKSPADSYRPL